MRARLLAATLLAVLPLAAPAQEATGTPTWSVAAEAYQYFHPDGNFLLPILRADRGPLHLEARWHYEDAKTLSAWAGWTCGCSWLWFMDALARDCASRDALPHAALHLEFQALDRGQLRYIAWP